MVGKRQALPASKPSLDRSRIPLNRQPVRGQQSNVGASITAPDPNLLPLLPLPPLRPASIHTRLTGLRRIARPAAPKTTQMYRPRPVAFCTHPQALPLPCLRYGYNYV